MFRDYESPNLLWANGGELQEFAMHGIVRHRRAWSAGGLSDG